MKLAVLPLLALAAISTAQTAPPRPNILFILCDDLGYGDLGSFGQTHFTTPHLDAFAKGGMRLTHHYAGAPVCAPSRACLLLGQHTGHVAVRDQQFDREIPDTNTMATVLRYAGYHTYAVGKWGLGGTIEDGFPAHPVKRGFDAWYGLYRHEDGHVHYPDAKHPFFDGTTDITEQVKDCYSTDLYTAKAKQWITEQAQKRPGEPFFMYLAYIAPHEAFNIPDGPYPAGGGLKGGVQLPLVTHPEMKNRWIYPEFVDATYREDDDPSKPAKPWTWQMQHYATMIKRIDEAVGDLERTLADLHLDKDTLVVFTSDNGPAYDDGLHPTQFRSWGILDGFKRDLFEGGFREPTLVSWPGHVRAGSVDPQPSAQFDWLPTFAELAGVTPPVTSDGNSLARRLNRYGTAPTHSAFYFEFQGPSNRLEDRQVLTRHGYTISASQRNDPWGQQQAVRIGDYIGVRAQITNADTPLRLYNAVTDAHEDHDLAAEPKFGPLVNEMYERMRSSRIYQPGNPRPYDQAPMAPAKVSSLKPGLECWTYPDPTPWAPDTRSLKPVGHSVSLDGPASLTPKLPTTYVWTGYVNAPESGRYVFEMTGGDTAHLWIHEAHVLDSEADKGTPRRRFDVYLAKGWHPLKIEVTAHQNESINLQWQTPSGGGMTTVPSDALKH